MLRNTWTCRAEVPSNFAGAQFVLRADKGQDGNPAWLGQGLQDYMHLTRTLHSDMKEGQLPNSFRPVRLAYWH